MLKTKSDKKVLIYSVILLAFLIVLCYTFPYTGDDWAWGSSIGIERYNSFFAGYNGRYLGNIIVIILTRSELLKTLCMAGVLFGIIFISYRYTNKKNITLLFISSLCILALPRLVLRQAVVWTSGFTNYAISIFLILIYIYIVKNIFNNERPKYPKYLPILLLILGICNALFVEHITLYSIVLGIFVIIYTYIRFKKIYSAQIAYLLGAIIGAVIMFTNSSYSAILSSKDTYRSIPNSGVSGFISTSIDSYFEVIYKELFFNNIVINILIAITAIIIIYKYNSNNKNKIRLIASNLIGLIIVSYSAYSLLASLNTNWKVLLESTDYFDGIFSIVYYIAILFLIILFINDKNRKAKMLFILISIACLTGPLFVVKPIGSRCFLATYVMFMLLINEFIDYIMIDNNSKVLMKCINRVIIVISILFAVYLLSIYTYVAKVNNERMDYIMNEVASNKKEIIITELPYEEYLWTATPRGDETWDERLKLFYGIPQDIELKTVSLDEWNEMRGKK